MKSENRIHDHLTFLYGKQKAERVWPQLQARLTEFGERYPHMREKVLLPSERLSERDAILITYGDQIHEPGRPPLQTLADFVADHLRGVVSGVHLLPFYPYSSDDGFSVIDYRQVDPQLGSWSDVGCLGQNFQLMFDAVINHISRHSAWFQAFLRRQSPYTGYFIVVDPTVDLSTVVRPRALPLLTAVETIHGVQHVWTTFSDDQIDLNYANSQVLLEIVDLLLFYVAQGAKVIRLDAIAYLWKEIGSPCIHLPQVHRVVKLFRAVLDAVAPGVILITETNVPHEENVSYFGNGSDEAQMVYQFSLPPLVLHTFHTGDVSRLSEWAGGLNAPSSSTTFFNFLASHDGVGVRPVEGILSSSEVQAMVERTLAHGGYVSYKAEPDGSQTVYELNISYFDALSDPHAAEPLDLQARRFLASQAIMLSLAGVPGIYVHSLFGSRSYRAGVEQTGRYRSINREKLRRDRLEREVADPASLRHKVLYPYLHIIRTRAAHPAFHPAGSQQVLSLDPTLFVLLRGAPDGSESLLCIHNVSNAERLLRVDLDALAFFNAGHVRDLIAGTIFRVDTFGTLNLFIAPYQVLWLTGNGNVT